MNKAIMIGNLTKDPDVRTTPSGVNVCSFSIAVNRRRANADGEKVTDFFNIIAWRSLADNCGKYLAKGRKVCVVGEIQNRSYEKDGAKKYITEIIAEDVEFLTPKSKDDAQPDAAAHIDTSGFEEVEDEQLPF